MSGRVHRGLESCVDYAYFAFLTCSKNLFYVLLLEKGWYMCPGLREIGRKSVLRFFHLVQNSCKSPEGWYNA